MSDSNVLEVPQGTFRLERLHPEPTLRAWDAADAFVLTHLAEHDIDGDRWLVANDGHGALATALAGRHRRLVSWTDSWTAMRATVANAARAGVEAVDAPTGSTSPAPGAVTLLGADRDPDVGPFDVVVVKVPRTLAFLREQLADIRSSLHAGSVVMGAGMTKQVHTSTVSAFEELIGPTETTRAWRKSRLLLARPDPSRQAPGPDRWTAWSTGEIDVHSRTNVFSAGALDAGARCLLDHLPDLAEHERGLDLGCGTGVLAATARHRAARHSGRLHIDVVDESFHAVASAVRTLAAVGGGQGMVSDAGEGVEASFDLILCNPPFHAGGARTTAVAHRMFGHARRLLAPGGRLLVVGNRHLRHDRTLGRTFAAVEVVGSDPRFVVVSARAN